MIFLTMKKITTCLLVAAALFLLGIPVYAAPAKAKNWGCGKVLNIDMLKKGDKACGMTVTKVEKTVDPDFDLPYTSMYVTFNGKKQLAGTYENWTKDEGPGTAGFYFKTKSGKLPRLVKSTYDEFLLNEDFAVKLLPKVKGSATIVIEEYTLPKVTVATEGPVNTPSARLVKVLKKK